MPKTKISVTIESALVQECDRRSGKGNRSEAVEKALAAWLRERRRGSLEEETERYYASLPDRDRKEDSRWVNLAGRSLGETWE